MQLTWLGAAGFKVDTDEGATILIDPFLSRPEGATPLLSLQAEDLLPVDEIFLTNGRFDHAMDIPALVRQSGAIVHAPEPVCSWLAAKGLSPNSLQCVTLKQKKRVGSLTWQAFPGRFSQVDSSPVLRALLRNRAALAQVNILERQWPLGEVVIYLFEIGGLLMVHFGSAGWIESEINGLCPDVALLPVESPTDIQTNVVRLAIQLKPRLIIPHHWDNYYPSFTELVDLSEFEKLIQLQLPQTRLYIPAIGQPFDLLSLLR